MKLHVEVTAEDIRNGRPEECRACPVALAIGRVLPGSCVSVFGDHGNVTVADRTVTFLLPPEASDFVAAFDRDEAPGPFAFDIGIDAPGATP